MYDINVNEIVDHIDNGDLTELSGHSKIPYRTLQEWRLNNNNWLRTAVSRFDILQSAINKIKSEYRVNDKVVHMLTIDNYSTKDSERYMSYIDDGGEDALYVEVAKPYAISFITKLIMEDDSMGLALDNALDYEFSDNELLFTFGDRTFVTSTIRLVPSPHMGTGYFATDIHSGREYFLFTTNRQYDEITVIKSVFYEVVKLRNYTLEEVMGYLKDEYGFRTFWETSDATLERMRDDLEYGFEIY